MNYKNYDRFYIGSSAVSFLTCLFDDESHTGHRNVCQSSILAFKSPDSYYAYLVDENAEIGPGFELFDSGSGCLSILDDERRLFKTCKAEEIRIYRSNEDELIIQFIGATRFSVDLWHWEDGSGWSATETIDYSYYLLSSADLKLYYEDWHIDEDGDYIDDDSGDKITLADDDNNILVEYAPYLVK